MKHLTKKTALIAGLALAANVSMAEWTMERFESRHPATDIDTVRISNLRGDIRVRTTGEDLIEVTAIMQRDENVPAPKVLVDYDADPATIAVSISAPESPGLLQRVDLTVSLPDRIALITLTDAGLLELKGRAASVDARSTTGRIFVSTSAPVDAHNEHGPIEIVFSGSPAGSIETLTGDITTWLPRESSARISVRSQSQITTDYTVKIKIDEDGFRNGQTRIGSGRSRLDIRSVRGAVHLLRPGR